ncbi:NAD(P)/FAD-dependent oxidoreductase [Nocardioides sp. YIM 152588]|uniref:phytoene desaturase family protein n=1 Tax=Nocardioides sp. YIM 152588 TaxID=3158259 RepID=UPI0032E4E1DA
MNRPNEQRKGSAIVVGAGHNGLVAAVRLARAGWAVTVLEQGSEPGGCVWTETHPSGVLVERGAWEHGGIHPVATELGLDIDYRPHPVAAGFHFGDGTQRVFWTDLERTLPGLGADAPAYRGLVELSDTLFSMLGTFETPPTLTQIGAALAAVPGGDELFRLMIQPAETVIEAQLDDPYTRAALALQASHAQVPAWAPGTGLFAFMLPLAHGGTSVRPVGGSAALTRGLVAALEAAGGIVRVDSPVVGIATTSAVAPPPADAPAALADATSGPTASKKGAYGGSVSSGSGAVMGTSGPTWAGGGAVTLADGTVLTADAVVSTIGVPRTTALLADEAPALRAAGADLHSGHFNVAELTVTIVQSERVALPWEDGDSIWYACAEPGDVRRGFAEVMAGQLPASPWSMVGDVAQPAGVAGGATWLSSIVPLERADGPWTAELEREAGERLVDHTSKLIGVDLRAGAVDVVVSGPLTWQRRIGGDGSPNHLDNTLDQLLGWRTPGHADQRTELPWLFLAGAGQDPGGGLTGASGTAAAAAVTTPVGARGGLGARVSTEVRGLTQGLKAYRTMRKSSRKGARR